MAITKLVPYVPVADLERAKKFYQEKFGFRVVREDPSPGVTLEGPQGRIYLYKGKPAKADSPVVDFVVDSVESTMEELKGKGITFKDINLLNIKSVKGLYSMDGYRMAAFRDTEGNTIAISNM